MGIFYNAMSESYSGEIPPIADKEKRGQKIKIPLENIYITELTTNVEINIPTAN